MSLFLFLWNSFLYQPLITVISFTFLISVFVETLDKCFRNVCELDIVFNFNKVNPILLLYVEVIKACSSQHFQFL